MYISGLQSFAGGRKTAFGIVAAVLLTLVCGSLPASAETRLGGHFGIVLPLATHFDGDTTDITDNFTIGFPMGITVKKSDRLAFDLEFVPVLDTNPQEVNLVIHPGVLFGLGKSYTAGVRMAFETDSNAWGFTPLIARGFPIKGKSASYFVELDLPIRVQENSFGDSKTAVGLAFHTGIGF